MWKRRRWIAIALLLAAPAAALPSPVERLSRTQAAAPEASAWLDEVAWIISPLERRVYLELGSERDRRTFIEAFWRQRDPSPRTEANEFKTEHYRRLDYVRRHFTTLAEPGWKTAAGRLYIVAGQTKIEPTEVVLRLRVLEGRREGSLKQEQPVTSSFLKFMQAETIESETSLEEETSQIRRVFNLGDVALLTETRIVWEAREASRAFHFFSLEDRDYAILVTPKDLQRALTFRVEVLEQGPRTKANLLDTEVSLPGRNLAVFGFEDTAGKPYFVSLRPVRWSGKMGDSSVAVVQIKEEVGAAGEQTKDRKPPVGGVGLPAENRPRLRKSVEPVYPAEARRAGVEGIVIVEATTDEDGNVSDIKVLRSVPMLDRAAIDAVKQYKFDPAIIEGEPRSAILTITVRFQLEDKEKKKLTATYEEFARGAVKVIGEIRPPRLVHSVEPVYPEKARQARVEGVVILAVRTGAKGHVEDLMVLRSIPLLDQAAIDAVKLWRYEPLLVNGEAKPAVFTATVRFQLK